MRAKKAIPKDFQEEFERIAVEQGKLAPTATEAPNEFADIVAEVQTLIQKQKRSDDAILNAAEPDAPHRKGKKRPPSPGSL